MCIATMVAPLPGLAQQMEFDGVVEAARLAVIAPGRDGKVERIFFAGGEQVTAGSALIRLDDAFQHLAVERAEAALASAEATAADAGREAARLATLIERKAVSVARSEAARTAHEVALANAAVAAADLDAARLELERSTLRAPIDGYVGRPGVKVGAFVEAEAGPPLATIVQIDPVLVGYDVPYDVRIALMQDSGASTLQELFAMLELRLEFSNGVRYAHAAQPSFAEATVDPATGMLRVWAEFQNPDGVLRPGMSVRVHSRLAPGAADGTGGASE